MSILTNAKSRAGLFGLGLALASSPLALAAVIEGTVAAPVAEDGETAPLEGAIVTIQETGAQAATERDGGFRFPNVAPGDYTLIVDYFGAGTETVEVTVGEGAPVDLSITLAEGDMTLGPVVVTGQRGAIYAARQKERAADGLISVLSSDAIGSLPDQNVAESLRRAAGVSIQLDQGEGRFVSIRGLAPSLNSTSINGVRLPAPEGDTRAVALDVIDSDALESITISKSLTPDMDGDGIGGSIDIETTTAFDRGGRYLRAKALGIYSESSEEWGEKINLGASDIFMDGALGIAGSITWNRRDFQTENVETDGPWITDTALPYPEEYEMRDYIVERERLSATLNFDYKLGANTDLYLRTLFNDFSDQEFRSRVEVKLDDAEFAGAAAPGVASFEEGDEIEFDRDIKDRLETQQIWSIQTGGETRFGANTLDYQVAFTHAEEEEPDRVDTGFRADDVGDAAEDVLFGLNVADTMRPRVNALDADTFQYFYDPDNFAFDGLEYLNGLSEDEELALATNFRRDTDLLGAPGFWKVGAKVRLRQKDRDVDLTAYDGFDSDDDLLLSQFQGAVDFPLDILGPVPDPGTTRSFFFANRDSFEVAGLDTAAASVIEDYEAEENIYAAYAMAQVNPNPYVRVTGGVRLEGTDFSASGFSSFVEAGVFDTLADIPTAPGDDVLFEVIDEGAGEYERVSSTRNRGRDSYLDILPSVNVRIGGDGNFITRMAYYESIARPEFSQIVPAVESEFEFGDGEFASQATVGNPDLERQKAQNADLSFDYYADDSTVISAGIFYKDIDNAIAEQTVFGGTFFGQTYDEATQAINLGSAEVMGAEFSFYNVFDGLPAPFDGLLVGANFTRVSGSAELGQQEIDLPGLSDTVANVILGYDKYGLDVRLAANYRSEYLDEIGVGGQGFDRYIDERFQLDLQAQYDITDQLELQAEINNITDEPFEAYLSGFDTKLLSQYEEYGYTARIGLRFRY